MIPTHSTQSDRPFRTDNRAVSEVIGAILVFALLFLVIALIQLNAVPAANKQVEFDHNQRVVGDFQELQDGIYRASSTGQEGASPVETGVSYPSRFFLLNPGPSTGTLRTTGEQELLIHNATAVGNIGDFWNGTLRNYSTTGLTYEPNYKELSGAGTLHLEHSMLYRDFGEDNRYFDDPTGFVDGNRIRLTLLTGEFSRNSLSTSVELAPVSHQQRTITVENSSEGPITITFQTDIDVGTLRTNTDAGSDESNVLKITKSGDITTMTLRPGVSYELTISKVRVGSTNVQQPGPQYITDVSGNGTSIVEGQSTQLVVEVRDRYNNPVSGVEVSATTGSEFTEDEVTPIGSSVTDNDGQVRFRYDAPPEAVGNIPVNVTAQFENPDDSDIPLAQRRARFDVTVLDPETVISGANATDGDRVSAINPGSGTQFVTLENVTKDSNNQFNLVFRNYGSQQVQFNQTRISYYYDDGTGPTPMSVEIFDGETSLSNMTSIPSDFVPVDPRASIGSRGSPSNTKTLQLELGTQGGSLGEDFFILSIQYVAEDETPHSTVTYFVGIPRN